MLMLGYARELALSFSVQVSEQSISTVIIGGKHKLLHNRFKMHLGMYKSTAQLQPLLLAQVML